MTTRPDTIVERRRLVEELAEAEQLRDAVKRDVEELLGRRRAAEEAHDDRLRDLHDRNATVHSLEYQLAATLDTVTRRLGELDAIDTLVGRTDVEAGR